MIIRDRTTVTLVKVEEVMRTSLITLSLDSTLEEAVQVMSNIDAGRVVILEGEEVRGILSTRDIVELFATLGKDMLKLSVSSVAKQGVTTVAPRDELEIAVRKMLWGGFGGLPVVENGKLVGLLSEREILKVVSRSQSTGIVDSVMTSSLVTTSPDTPIRDIAKLMANRKVRRLPLLEGEEVKGIVTAADLVKGLKKGGEKAIEVGSKSVIWCMRETHLRDAASIMVERRIGSLIVGKGEKKPEGIVTERDLLFGSLNVIQ
ncbi:histidine kinase [Sulfodiicoccus acidiphilus]|uniref:Histidine kinase n=1 Tax=Sulfodiicoccus acidiphilus TaxID=1670455 RepID=A0A348B436_9CREN|nr:CBS domain-containing protein [Sulfodiicoccus acidiphilus]BBD72938.1 histidine kinase [Sulfodiicoccus acidiphilus]GGT87855.1 histidine kinase [Sulfodiicoccus acidiphilus]